LSLRVKGVAMGCRVKTSLRVAAWCLLWGGPWGQTAHAWPIVSFTDPQTFFGTAGVVSTETFDEFPPSTDLGVRSVTLDGVTYTSSNPSAIWSASDTFSTPSPPNSLVARNVIAPATLTLGEGNVTGAIGFYLVGVGGIPPASYRIDVLAIDGERLSETLSPGAVTVNIFRGFTSEEGILSVAISPVEVGGNLSNFHLDNVSRGAITAAAVPEPSTLGMAVAAALLALGYARRCRGRLPT
jgi:hypothetical protein